ncbi:MAG: methylenetetrahydrofolate reductase [Chloroflexota bacterium]
MGIRNLFVTMGDPTRIGDYPEAMDSYDIVPTGLIELIKFQFNQGLDKAGQSIGQPTSFVVGGALSLTPKNREQEMKLLHKKVSHGADFALTQPVFDPEAAIEFLSAYEETYGQSPPPIVAGIKPLYNSRNAEFLHNECRESSSLKRSGRVCTRQPIRSRRVIIAQEIMAVLRPYVHGYYIMPAFGRYDLAADVLDILNERAPAA